MSKYRIIRNNDGSAYVQDHMGRHVSTHDTSQEAEDHVEKLKDEKPGPTKESETHHWKE